MDDNEVFNKIYNEIRKLYDDILYTENDYIQQYGEPQDQGEYESMQYTLYDIRDKLPNRFVGLYNQIIFFLTKIGQNVLCDEFKKRFRYKMFSKEEIFKTEDVEEYDCKDYPLIRDINQFFISLLIFYKKNDDITLDVNRNTLNNILKSLSFHVKDKEIKKEKDFFDIVYPLVRSSFPLNQQHPHLNFVKKLKSYLPDIFIPECKALLELKYIDSEAKLISCFESIDVDEKGYSGNFLYSQFYAVFYMTKEFKTEPEMLEIWKERNYPQNWFYIPVYKKGV